MSETRRSARWMPVLIVAVLLAVVALAGGGAERVLRLARGVSHEARLADLPAYAAWSLLRMTASYVASLVFAWVFGYAAATYPRAARILIPMLDVGQSVPVLGFFPAAIAIFVGIFGGGRLAFELAAIFLIFTCQAWNLAFAVYEGLSTIPAETRAAADSLGVQGVLRWRALYVPACIPSLVYNSILSWTNGWYFLIACEIIVAGRTAVSLPGLGSLLQRSFAQGDLRLSAAALLTLLLLVVVIEFVVWQPIRVWSQRFRYDLGGAAEEETRALRLPDLGLPALLRPFRALTRALLPRLRFGATDRRLDALGDRLVVVWRWIRWPLWIAAGVGAAFGVGAVVHDLMRPWSRDVASLPLALLLSFLRINAAYALALLWVIPVTLWAFDHPKSVPGLSLLAQIGASIPATAFFPFLVALLVDRFGGMEVISIGLALTGMQWYLLFNALAGVQRVPTDLHDSLRSLGLKPGAIHRKLVLPACMPSLVTGSVVAWGGTWNALILSEYIVFKHRTYEVLGVGALLNRATFGTGDRTLLLLSVTALVVTVVAFNRLVWKRVFETVNDRFRLEA